MPFQVTMSVSAVEDMVADLILKDNLGHALSTVVTVTRYDRRSKHLLQAPSPTHRCILSSAVIQHGSTYAFVSWHDITSH